MSRVRKKKEAAKDGNICENMSFTANEAYKMLRTKLSLILPVEEENRTSRIIGVTSAMRGEGKTTTAINLGYAFAESKKRVLLIEADMRLPSMAKRLDLQSSPGLSEYLTSDSSVVVQYYKTRSGERMDVISSGEIPPLPSELLESRKMKKLLNLCSKEYDYVIVDLPPVTLVTDAIVMSSMLDGMLLVVREDYCDARSLRDTMNQFTLADVKLLGVVMNESNGLGANPVRYRSGYAQKYGDKYGYAYKKESTERENVKT